MKTILSQLPLGSSGPGHLGFILNATYVIAEDGDRAVVQLYGKLQDGRPFLIRDRRPEPYFYIASSARDRARAAGVTRLTPTDRVTLTGERVDRVGLTLPQDAPPLRTRLHRAGVPTYEADVRFAYRYLIDRGIQSGVAIHGTPQPLVGNTVVFDDPELEPAAWTPELTILSFDIETDPDPERLLSIALWGCGAREVLLWCPDAAARASCPAGAVPCASEQELLATFAERVRALDPDVLTGWSIIDYDVPVLLRRAAATGVALELGRAPGAMRQRGGNGAGRGAGTRSGTVGNGGASSGGGGEAGTAGTGDAGTSSAGLGSAVTGSAGSAGTPATGYLLGRPSESWISSAGSASGAGASSGGGGGTGSAGPGGAGLGSAVTGSAGSAGTPATGYLLGRPSESWVSSAGSASGTGTPSGSAGGGPGSGGGGYGGRRFSDSVFIPGRVVLDGIRLLRAVAYRLPSYSLDNAAREILGEGKRSLRDPDDCETRCTGTARGSAHSDQGERSQADEAATSAEHGGARVHGQARARADTAHAVAGAHGRKDEGAHAQGHSRRSVGEQPGDNEGDREDNHAGGPGGEQVGDFGSSAVDRIRHAFAHQRERFVDYNLTDARLVYDILEKLQLVPFTVERSKLTGMPPDRVGASIAAFDFLYLSQLHARGVVAPTVGAPPDPAAGSHNQGGHVLEPRAGLHDNVLVFDFKSLYPSIIRTFQIDPLGLVRAAAAGGPAPATGAAAVAAPASGAVPTAAASVPVPAPASSTVAGATPGAATGTGAALAQAAAGAAAAPATGAAAVAAPASGAVPTAAASVPAPALASSTVAGATPGAATRTEAAVAQAAAGAAAAPATATAAVAAPASGAVPTAAASVPAPAPASSIPAGAASGAATETGAASAPATHTAPSSANGAPPAAPIEAPNGARFHREPAILSGLLDDLFASRERAKRTGNRVASNAIKILMNSFYGVLGTPSCRFSDPRLANAITGFGKHFLLWAKAWMERRGLQVLYGDTDSLFVATARATATATAGVDQPLTATGGRALPEPAATAGRQHTEPGRPLPEPAARLAGELNRDLTAYIRATWRVPSHLEMEFERHYERLFLPPVRGGGRGATKRYVGMAQGKLHFTGMEVVRRDWTALAHEVQRELYRRLFADEPLEEYLRQVIGEVAAGRRDAQLVYHKALHKEADAYQAVPPHVAAARKRTGPPSPDSRREVIDYVITVAGPEPVESRADPLDYEHYIDRQIRPVAEPVLAIWRRDFGEVRRNERQLELF